MDGVGGAIATAIAIDKDKNSQYAVKWALEKVVDNMSCVVLLHVLTQTTLPDEAGIGKDGRPPTEAEMQQFFHPSCSLCALKGVRTKEVVLKDSDASNALVLYVTRNAITDLVVGSRSRLTRAFKSSADVASSLQRSLPDTCNLFAVSKSRNQKLKSAIQSPAPNTYSVPTEGTENSFQEVDLLSKCNTISGSIGFGRTPFARSIARRMSGDDLTVMPPRDNLLASRTLPGELHDFNANKILDKSHTSNAYGLSISSQNAEVDDEISRVKLELKKTMDVYHSVCREATHAKQKETEIYQYMPPEVAEAARAMLEMEKQKSKAAIEAAQKAQLLAELESHKRRKSDLKAEHEASERTKLTLASTQSTIQYRKYTIEDIEIATDYFSNTLKIGEGGYGPVFRGNLDHIFVAIKVLRPDISQGESQFQKEVEVLTCIRHPHMVLLMGACPEYGCLIYEFMENGSLEDRLFRKNNTAALPWSLRFKICAEIATALHFLHQTRPQPLVHRDLKPGNILLDRNYVSKISDVGLARLVPPEVADDAAQYHITAAAGTFCYIDPEYQQTGILGTKSDLYSFGVILLQVITGKSPMGLTHQVMKAIKEGKFEDVLDPAVIDWPVEETMCLAKLGLQCCDMRKKGRPDLGSVILPELKRLRDLGDAS